MNDIYDRAIEERNAHQEEEQNEPAILKRIIGAMLEARLYRPVEKLDSCYRKA